MLRFGDWLKIQGVCCKWPGFWDIIYLHRACMLACSQVLSYLPVRNEGKPWRGSALTASDWDRGGTGRQGQGAVGSVMPKCQCSSIAKGADVISEHRGWQVIRARNWSWRWDWKERCLYLLSVQLLRPVVTAQWPRRVMGKNWRRLEGEPGKQWKELKTYNSRLWLHPWIRLFQEQEAENQGSPLVWQRKVMTGSWKLSVNTDSRSAPESWCAWQVGAGVGHLGGCRLGLCCQP